MTTDDRTAPQPVAPWFRWGAWASLAWMLLGVASYLYNVSVDPATLPADQKAINDAVPGWMVACFAIAVWAGLVGAILLVMRMNMAEPVLLISLLGCIGQYAAYFVDPELREAVPSEAMAFPTIILALTWTVYWFARHSRQRGWLA